MCGIAGFVSRTHRAEPDVLRLMAASLDRRGPNDEGYFIYDNLGLAHKRLSIIDLKTGHQPMHCDDGTVSIVFNGEIYNFLSLRQELLRTGLVFSTTSDTEVIIQGYRAWGISKLLGKLEGMFAFALFDKKTGTLFIGRDRIGEKPVYYSLNRDRFCFASELKAIRSFTDTGSVNLTALNFLLTLTYIPAPHTIYNGVFKLEAGHYITLNLQAAESYKVLPYYSLKEDSRSSELIVDYGAAKKELRELLFSSVEDRMIADVPIGSFLSGGLDSSIISAIMAKVSRKPINTFSIGFREKAYDESDRAALIATHIKSNHHVHFVSPKDILDKIDDVVDYFDEPFADNSALPSYFVAKVARSKVAVALTGDAADELFGGYEKYLGPMYIEKLKAYPEFIRRGIKVGIDALPVNPITNHFLRKARKVTRNIGKSHFDLHYSLMCLGFGDHERQQLLEQKHYRDVRGFIKSAYEDLPERSEIDRGFYTDIKYVLEGQMLAKVDRMSMCNSLETRVPFLDTRIVKFSQQIPVGFKIVGKNKKRILKDTFADLLPDKTLSFGKKGFGLPVAWWFKKELKGELLALVDARFLEKQGIFNSTYVSSVVQAHMSGRENVSHKLWTLFVFQKWYNKNFA